MTTTTLPAEIWDHEAMSLPPSPIDWFWHGYLAAGNLTLLTSLWKAGKTTLLSMLLARRNHGGTLAGLAVKPGKTIVVSEEPMSLWTDRARRYDFGGNVCFLLQPSRTIPSAADWQTLLDRVLVLRQEHAIDLLVLDPLAPLLRAENNAQALLETLLPLGTLTRQGMAVLLLHHPAKRDHPVGQAARGSGALLGHVDISIEMRRPGGDPATRRRRFLALSRHTDTPRQLLLDLNADATDYVPVTDAAEEDFQTASQSVRFVLEDAPQKLTRDDILADWPPDAEQSTPMTLWRTLRRALDAGLVACEGLGRKADPFRYWLPQREAAWKQDPFYELIEKQRRDLNLPFESLQEKKSRLRDAPQL